MSMVAYLFRIPEAELGLYLTDSSLLGKRLEKEDEITSSELLYLDKTWDGIIFLLTGASAMQMEHPLSSIVFSGQLIDEEQDLGYGPAHYLTADQVAVLGKQLAAITPEILRKGYDPVKMMETEIYPKSWENGDDFLYLERYFMELQRFYAEASATKKAIITFLS